MAASGLRQGPRTSTDAAPALDSASIARARHLLSAAIVTFAVGLAVGSGWDVYWHSQRTFDSFWSPPHLIMYSGVASAGIFAATVAAVPSLRRWFGPAVQLPFVPFPVPTCLLFIGTSVVVTLLGGALDSWWHATQGLDETRWSLPHAMVACGIYLVLLGFLSCRAALRPHHALSRSGAVVLGVLVFAISMTVYLGPFFTSTTADSMRLISMMPGFQGAETQHYFRLVARWDLYRSNPLFPALVGLWAGAGIGVVRGFDRSPRTLLEVTAAATAISTLIGMLSARYVGTLDSPGTWIPPLAFPAAVVLLMMERRARGPHTAAAVAGAALGLFTFATYGGGAAAAIISLLAATTLPLGLVAGGAIWRVVEHPEPNSVAKLVAVVGILVPTLLGALDFFLRVTTP